MKGNTPEQDRRQNEILARVHGHVRSAFEEGETYSNIVDRGYFLGAIALQVLLGGYAQAEHHNGQSVADEWLVEHFRGLASMLGEGTGRRISITYKHGPTA